VWSELVDKRVDTAVEEHQDNGEVVKPVDIIWKLEIIFKKKKLKRQRGYFVYLRAFVFFKMVQKLFWQKLLRERA